MATLKSYSCDKCGYSVYTNFKGKYALMSGPHTNYVCSHCKEVVAICDFDVTDSTIACPTCAKEGLTPWSPKCGCPKCGGKMAIDKDGLMIMAD